MVAYPTNRVFASIRPVHPKSEGGAPWPCRHVECRIRHVDGLARFAALYADRIAVLSPFQWRRDGDSIEEVRAELAEDLGVVHYLRDLVDAQIVTFVPSSAGLCAEHLIEYKRLRRELTRAAKAALTPYLSEVKISRESEHGYTYLGIEGPEALIEHGGALHLARGDALEWKGRHKMTHLLRHFAPILHNLLLQNLVSQQTDANYLSSRPLDLQIAGALNEPSVNLISNALLEGFEHGVPFIQGVPIRNLVRLRQENEEHFKIYRDAVTSTLKKLKAPTAGEVQEALSESVMPEVRRLNALVSDSKGRARRSLLRDGVVTSAFIGVGLFEGILPSGVGPALMAVGGLNFLRGATTEIDQLFNEPKEARESRYYFLWKSQSGRRPRGK